MKRIIITCIVLYAMMGVMAQNPMHFYPEENSNGINVDTHLVIQFDQNIEAGNKGKITVYDYCCPIKLENSKFPLAHVCV